MFRGAGELGGLAEWVPQQFSGRAFPSTQLREGVKEVRADGQRLGKNIGEQQTLRRAMVRHANASLALANTVSATCL